MTSVLLSFVSDSSCRQAIDPHLGDRLADRAFTHKGRMGILGIEQLELARTHLEVGRGRLGIEGDITRLIERRIARAFDIA